MISIIICSRKGSISEEFLTNLDLTIGCVYELIVIDNSQNEYSIFEAYNLGISKSKGDFLCFMHDDILIHSKDWGIVLENIFKSNSAIGLVGVAGSKIKTKMPSGWWGSPYYLHEVNILQHLANNEIEKWEYGLQNELLSEVVVIDGVFMAMKSSNHVFFDNQLKGFHNYDVNISIENATKGHKIVVTREILVEHFSCGMTDKIWFESTLEFYKKYNNKLPLRTKEIDPNLVRQIEFTNGVKFISEFLNYGFETRILRIWFRLILIRPTDKFHIDLVKVLVRRFIKYRIIGFKINQ